MTLFQNNPSPYLTMVEGTEPTAPATGQQRLYIDSTSHHLSRTDENGDEIDLEAGGNPDAANVTYTPATAADWDSSADPGDTNDALDQLAARVADLEGAGTGLLTLLASASPNGSTGTVTFNSIPGTHKRLIVKFKARSDKASVASESINVYLNNDTTATNYYKERLSGIASTASAAAADDAALLPIPAATGLAGSAGQGQIVIEDYADTTFSKTVLGQVGFRSAAASADESLRFEEWENTAAVTRIDLVIAGNYVAGSHFYLYGED